MAQWEKSDSNICRVKRQHLQDRLDIGKQVALRKHERLYLEVGAKAKPESKRKPETWRTDASKAKVPKHGTDGPQGKAKARAKAKSAMEFGASMEV